MGTLMGIAGRCNVDDVQRLRRTPDLNCRDPGDPATQGGGYHLMMVGLDTRAVPRRPEVQGLQGHWLAFAHRRLCHIQILDHLLH
ncbi:hypothetical protein D3C75_956820 [compost metagenome]